MHNRISTRLTLIKPTSHHKPLIRTTMLITIWWITSSTMQMSKTSDIHLLHHKQFKFLRTSTEWCLHHLLDYTFKVKLKFLKLKLKIKHLLFKWLCRWHLHKADSQAPFHLYLFMAMEFLNLLSRTWLHFPSNKWIQLCKEGSFLFNKEAKEIPHFSSKKFNWSNLLQSISKVTEESKEKC